MKLDKISFAFGLCAGAAAAVVGVMAVPGLMGAGDEKHRSEDVVERVQPPELERKPEADDARRGDGVSRTEVDKADPEVANVERPITPRLMSNEIAAIATLRNLVSAQAQFQASAKADEDQDGVGEFGTFGELSGAVPVRGTDRNLAPPVLASAFKKIKDGRVERSGYYFRIYLPQANRMGLGERGEGGLSSGEVGVDLAETHWCCYAWPKEPGKTGNRSFFVSQSGDILACTDESRCYGGEREPPSYAAFERSGHGITGDAVDNGVGADGTTWKQAG